MKKLHDQLRRIQKQRDRLRKRLEEAVSAQEIAVDEQLHADLKEIMGGVGTKHMDSLPASSFQHLFWQQQYKAAARGDSRGMRWHPLMIRWCIYRSQVPRCLRDPAPVHCVCLPSQRTLRDYTHFVKSTTGFSAEVDLQLMQAANIATCEEREKTVILILDEIYIREDLVFDKNTDMLIGFTNMEKINSHLLAFEHSLAAETVDVSVPVRPMLATTMMTFMVRGLFSSLQYPYAPFPCHQVKGDLLFNPFWEAVLHLERCEFKVCSYNLNNNY